MNGPFSGKVQRVSLGFSVEGLGARDEVLLKSLVRLLDHRTLHQWHHQPPGEGVALRVQGEGVALSAGSGGGALLAVGREPPAAQVPFLRLPLHADALELMLNQLGAQALQHPGPGKTPHPHHLQPPVPGTPPAAAGWPAGETFRIVRWPPAHLLNSPQRLKLATLMVGQAMSLDVLQQRAGVALAECEAFVRDLLAAGLLQGPAGDGAAAVPLAAAMPSVQAQAANPIHPAQPPTPARAPSGLLARIRSRLGLQARP